MHITFAICFTLTDRHFICLKSRRIIPLERKDSIVFFTLTAVQNINSSLKKCL